MKRQVKAEQSDKAPTYRLVRLTPTIRDGIKRRRSDAKNNQAVLDETVAATLPTLIKSLQALGFSVLVEETKGYRLPFGEDTLADLRDASELLGLPASHLLILCLGPLASPRGTRKKRKAK